MGLALVRGDVSAARGLVSTWLEPHSEDRTLRCPRALGLWTPGWHGRQFPVPSTAAEHVHRDAVAGCCVPASTEGG